MDYFLDVILCVLLELFKQIKPNSKLKKWQEVILIFLSVLLLLSTIGCLIAGVHILSSVPAYKTAGTILLAIGISLILLHCITYAVLIGLHLKAEAAKSKNDTAAENDNKNE